MPKKYQQSKYYDDETIRDMVFKGYTIIYKIYSDKIIILEIFNQNLPILEEEQMASVKFMSYVESDKIGGWYIKLVDTFDNTEVICKDLTEYKEKIEDMGAEYGNDIEVEWVKARDLTPANIQELQEAMAKLQEEYQKEIDELNNQQNENSGFNPNA